MNKKHKSHFGVVVTVGIRGALYCYTSPTLYNKLWLDVANPENYPLKVPLTLGGLPFLPLIRTDIQH